MAPTPTLRKRWKEHLSRLPPGVRYKSTQPFIAHSSPPQRTPAAADYSFLLPNSVSANCKIQIVKWRIRDLKVYCCIACHESVSTISTSHKNHTASISTSGTAQHYHTLQSAPSSNTQSTHHRSGRGSWGAATKYFNTLEIKLKYCTNVCQELFR